MQYYLGFDDFKVGQRVKIKGKPENDGKFAALEVSMKAPKDQSEIEGLLQEVDQENKTVRILNKQYIISSDTVGVDLLGNETGFEAFKTGDMVKLKGTYSESQGFVPRSRRAYRRVSPR